MGEIPLRIRGEDASAVRAIDNVIRKQKELGRTSKRTSDETAEGAGKVSSAFDDIAKKLFNIDDASANAFDASKIAAFQASIGGLTVVLGAVISAFEEVNRLSDDLSRKQLESAGGLRRLAQLGGGDESIVQQLSNQARTLLEGGGATDLNQAANLIFQLQSAGINTVENRGIFASLGGVIGDPATFARAASTLQTAFGGEGETGNIGDILSKAFAASAESPASAPALLEAAARAGALAQGLGIGDEEILAAVARTATTTGSAAAGGTQVAALLKVIGRDPSAAAAAREGGLAAVIANIQDRGLSGQIAFEGAFGKRAEAFGAFRSIAGGDLTGAAGRVGAAVDEDLVTRIAQSADADADVALARALRMAEARRDRAGADIGRQRTLVDLAAVRQEAQLLGEGKVFQAAAVRRTIDFRRSGAGRLITGIVGGSEGDLAGEAAEEGFLAESELSRGGVGFGGGGGAFPGSLAIGALTPAIFRRLAEVRAETAGGTIFGSAAIDGERLPDASRPRARSARNEFVEPPTGAERIASIQAFLDEGAGEQPLGPIRNEAGLATGLFASLANDQSDAVEALRRTRGGGSRESTAEILDRAGGFVDPEAGTRELLTSIRDRIAPMATTNDPGDADSG